MYSIQHIGAQLKAARVKKNLSQRALSARTKIPQNHISKIEQGEVNLQLSTLIEISRSLDLELMLVPRAFIPAVQALVKDSKIEEQVPKYQLDEEESND